MRMTLAAPFPYFGGKRRVADLVWAALGDVQNYLEPFFGSGAVLLARPGPVAGLETVNDADAMVSNFWRALQADPDAVAYHADWPVNENDLHARHAWLVGVKDSLQARLEGDPEFHDAKVAGWWAWGMSCWIGSGFCSGDGPWGVAEVGGVRKLVHLGDKGRGVNRNLVHLGRGQGVSRHRVADGLLCYLRAIADRMRHVRVCCGDWSRIMGDTPLRVGTPAGVFLDPPYATEAGRDMNLYRVESGTVAHAAREWAIEHGDDPDVRIVLCGYDGEHAMPEGWLVLDGKAGGSGHGFGGQAKNGYANANRERLWVSPHAARRIEAAARGVSVEELRQGQMSLLGEPK